MTADLSGRDLDVAVARAKAIVEARAAVDRSGSGASRHRAWSHFYRLCRNDSVTVARAALYMLERRVAVKGAKGDAT